MKLEAHLSVEVPDNVGEVVLRIQEQVTNTLTLRVPVFLEDGFTYHIETPLIWEKSE